MRTLNSYSINRLQQTQEETFLDTGYITSFTSTSGSYGEPIKQPITGSLISCGFSWSGGKESWKEPVNYLKADATVKLPINTSIDQTCNFTLTKKFNESLSTPIVFEVVSNARNSFSGIIVDLKKVEV